MIGCTETRSILFFFFLCFLRWSFSYFRCLFVARVKLSRAVSLRFSRVDVADGVIHWINDVVCAVFGQPFSWSSSSSSFYFSIFFCLFFLCVVLFCVDSRSLYFSSCSLSVSFSTELIPKPAQPCDAPPLYLRLRMGKPLSRKGAMTTPIMSYGKKKMKPEYWFSIPRDKYNLRILPSTLIPNVTHSL